ncbi:arad-like aldolase/epimerase [Panus rudis PR-1116 ss-1]|nr:arad-like aldolase/epimerase [Panus rudis PR-1116 ss-1]
MSPAATLATENLDTKDAKVSASKAEQSVPSVIRGAVPRPPVFEDKNEQREWLKFRLAQALRIFGNLGYDEGVAGHITIRDCIRTDCFWVNPMGKHFTLIQPEDLLLVDHDGKIQEGQGLLNTAAFMIHSALHAARPDMNCAAHSHSVYGRAFATLGKELDPLTQDSCAFYQDHGVYTQFGGVVLDDEEGRRIAETLGKKKAAILQNHGILVATKSIEATIHFYIALEKSCMVQLLADAAASGTGRKPIPISHEDAVRTYATVGTELAGWFSGLAQFQLLESKEGKSFKFSDSVKH